MVGLDLKQLPGCVVSTEKEIRGKERFLRKAVKEVTYKPVRLQNSDRVRIIILRSRLSWQTVSFWAHVGAYVNRLRLYLYLAYGNFVNCSQLLKSSILVPHLHDTTGCQTGRLTGLTTGCIV